MELARALGVMPGVYRVDLLTRQVSAPDVDWTYGEPTEMLNLIDSSDTMHEVGESGGAYIIRIPFGPKDKYVPKELLWPHIPEFVDGALSHIVQMSKVLGEQTGSGQPLWPVVIHGHYADAGESAALLSGALNVPMVLTGHSLGRDKLEQLLKQGRQPKEEINATYKIMRRIEAEELSLDVSEMIITSTQQEIEEQWNLYDGFDPKLERKLRARMKRNVSCYGRFMPRAMVSHFIFSFRFSSVFTVIKICSLSFRIICSEDSLEHVILASSLYLYLVLFFPHLCIYLLCYFTLAGDSSRNGISPYCST